MLCDNLLPGTAVCSSAAKRRRCRVYAAHMLTAAARHRSPKVDEDHAGVGAICSLDPRLVGV